MRHATLLGVRLTKKALGHEVDAAALEAVIATEDRNQVPCLQSLDFAGGVIAFPEECEPKYTGAVGALPPEGD